MPMINYHSKDSKETRLMEDIKEVFDAEGEFRGFLEAQRLEVITLLEENKKDEEKLKILQERVDSRKIRLMELTASLGEKVEMLRELFEKAEKGAQ